jgi:hypothetical protein
MILVAHYCLTTALFFGSKFVFDEYLVHTSDYRFCEHDKGNRFGITFDYRFL